jgi:hypothetical protein
MEREHRGDAAVRPPPSLLVSGFLILLFLAAIGCSDIETAYQTYCSKFCDSGTIADAASDSGPAQNMDSGATDSGSDAGPFDAGRRFVDVSLSDDITCARDPTGATWCWGDNTYGELGNGIAATGPSGPVQVNQAPLGAQVHAGRDFSCAFDPIDGGSAQILCWGRNDVLQLGDPTAGPQSPDAVAPGIQNVPAGLSVGTNHACTTWQFGLECWGSNSLAQLGEGPPTDGGQSPVPVDLPHNIPPASAVSSVDFSCALDIDGGLSCWGSNLFGQCAQPISNVDVDLPTAARAPDWVTAAMALGSYHGCVIAGDAGPSLGVLECWGSDVSGALNGDGGLVIPDASVPYARPLGPTIVESAAAGQDFTCAALQADGGVWCWGNLAGIVPGAGSTRMPPSEIPEFHATHPSVYAHAGRVCALLNGALWCWGDNTNWAAIGAPTPDGGTFVTAPTHVTF